MALADDLLQQGFHLANLDTRRPKQANLRRAISSAYYAVFHLLVSECMQKIGPASPGPLAARVARTLAHAEMKEVCLPISRNAPGTILQELLPGGFSVPMRTFTRAFVALQEARHEADYDLAADYTRSEALDLLEQARAAFLAWRSVRLSDEANVFLAALMFARRWAK